MAQDITNFVVSIHNQQGEIQGTGFVVDKRAVVTCVHVVEAAGADAEGTVKVRFVNAKDLVIAKVSPDGYYPHNDVSILTLDKDLPNNISPAILGSWKEAKHSEFWSFGYRPLGRFEGVPAEGRILDQVLEITSKPAPTQPVLVLSSQQINAGMSGSPVYVPGIDRVVAMTTAIWNGQQRDRDTAFAISAEAITAAWPTLALKSLGEEAPARLKPIISKIKSPVELELVESLEDYERANVQVMLIKQQLKETIELTQRDALQIKLDRLQQERREVYQKVQELQEERGIAKA